MEYIKRLNQKNILFSDVGSACYNAVSYLSCGILFFILDSFFSEDMSVEDDFSDTEWLLKAWIHILYVDATGSRGLGSLSSFTPW